MPKWFSETLHPSVRQTLKIKEVLHSGKTPFQKIQIVDTEQFGNTLILDGVVQTTEKDEFIYHEMMTHVPLFSHANPKRVLVIGGGDGGIVREILKHPVDEVYLVEIDEQVMTFSKKYLPTICKGAFQDARTRVRVEDGAKFITNQTDPFDIVIIDSTDPMGPAKVLFSKKFYQSIKRILSPEGILARQTGSTMFQPNEWMENYRQLKEFFLEVHPFVIAVPTYIGGFFSLTFASDKTNPSALDLEMLKARYGELRLKTRYYNPEIHQSCFRLPEYMKSRLPVEEMDRNAVSSTPH
ncbi:MAG: polyamine aminopropyltransferase [Candidatus Omnitrophica bacterium]|nr:polyamine aminopropyltransferase [Candidatus Omnitrophota bacterium]